MCVIPTPRLVPARRAAQRPVRTPQGKVAATLLGVVALDGITGSRGSPPPRRTRAGSWD